MIDGVAFAAFTTAVLIALEAFAVISGVAFSIAFAALTTPLRASFFASSNLSSNLSTAWLTSFLTSLAARRPPLSRSSSNPI